MSRTPATAQALKKFYVIGPVRPGAWNATAAAVTTLTARVLRGNGRKATF